MSQHVAVSPNEAADRLAIRELVESYAHCADRRDAKGQMSLFTADTHFRGLHERQGSIAVARTALA
jgi:SnoaL-like protein